jgi:hypothetical protein
MYVKITNDQPEKYTIGQLRRDNPQVSFPKDIPYTTLADYGVYPLMVAAPPAYDPITQNLTEGTPALIDGVWTQVWDVAEATPGEVERRKADQLESIKQQRAYLYTKEADPLFFKAQRGEGTMEEWEAKVQDIRARYPYPEEQVPSILWTADLEPQV